VLSLASGPVLGAFVVGVFTSRVGARAMLAGMVSGAVVLVLLWKTGSVGWTWYAFIGAATTAVVAVVSGRIAVPRSTS
jgi:Na+/proline symporter